MVNLRKREEGEPDDMLTFQYEKHQESIMLEICLGDFTIKGYLSVKESEELRSSLTKAINHAKKDGSE